MKCRALFVDDEPLVLSGLKRMLRSLRTDWDIAFAGSGAEALTLLADEPFDVVVSDMRMPSMDGAALLSHVASSWPGVARFVLSGHAELAAVLKAVRPAHRYFGKPCDPAVLSAALGDVRAVRLNAVQDSLRQKLGAHRRLPSPEATIRELQQALNDGADTDSLAAIVETDIAMTAQVLRIINSAFFGRPVETFDVGKAVQTLGRETVGALVEESVIFREVDSDDAHAKDVVIQLNAEAQSVADAAADPAARGAAMLGHVGPLASVEAASALAPDEQQHLTHIMLAFWGIAIPADDRAVSLGDAA